MAEQVSVFPGLAAIHKVTCTVFTGMLWAQPSKKNKIYFGANNIYSRPENSEVFRVIIHSTTPVCGSVSGLRLS